MEGQPSGQEESSVELSERDKFLQRHEQFLQKVKPLLEAVELWSYSPYKYCKDTALRKQQQYESMVSHYQLELLLEMRLDMLNMQEQIKKLQQK